MSPKRLSPLATFTLPADVRETLRAVSGETGIPQSQLVAEGLRWRLVQPEPVKVPT